MMSNDFSQTALHSRNVSSNQAQKPLRTRTLSGFYDRLTADDQTEEEK